MADQERFDADPDPTFQADADPAPNFCHLERQKKMSNFHFFLLHNLTVQNLSCVIFSVTMREESLEVRDKV